MYEWLLYAHLLGVALALAGLGAHTVSVERLRRSETTRELDALMSTSELGTRLVLIGGPLLIAAGLTMAIRSWSLTDGWIATAIALVLGQGVLGSIVDRRLKDMRTAVRAEPEGKPSSELSARMSDPVLHAGNGVSVAVIAEVLLLMTVKPAGWEIVWSLLGTAAVAGVAAWRAARLSGEKRGDRLLLGRR